EKGATPAQLALAWLLAQGEDIIPIPGTKRRSYLEENVEALSITLTKDDLARIKRGHAPRRRRRFALSRAADEDREHLGGRPWPSDASFSPGPPAMSPSACSRSSPTAGTSFPSTCGRRRGRARPSRASWSRT